MGDYGERAEKLIKAEDRLRNNAPLLLETLKEVRRQLSLAQLAGMELNEYGRQAVDIADTAIKEATGDTKL